MCGTGGCMDDQALGSSAVSATKSGETKHEDRSVWVLTAYGISGLALFGVLAYYFSDFIAR